MELCEQVCCWIVCTKCVCMHSYSRTYVCNSRCIVCWYIECRRQFSKEATNLIPVCFWNIYILLYISFRLAVSAWSAIPNFLPAAMHNYCCKQEVQKARQTSCVHAVLSSHTHPAHYKL